MVEDRRAVRDSGYDDGDVPGTSVDREIRRNVEYRLQARSRFSFYVLGLLVVNAMLWGIWATSSRGFPWPIFITLPSLVGLMAQGWRVYQYSPDASDRREEEIQREVAEEKRRRGL